MPSKYVFKLDPYDRQAKVVLKYLRRRLMPNYRLTVRGRGPRKDNQDSREVPLSRAKWVAVYVFRKDSTGFEDRLPTMRVPGPEPKKKKKPRGPAGGSLGDIFRKLNGKERGKSR